MTEWFKDPASLEAALQSEGPPDLGVPGYTDLLEIRSGAQGTVYQATRTDSGDRVAVKVMHQSASATGRLRFQREIELVSSLRHPGVVSAIDRGETVDGRAYYVMPFVDGLPLNEHVAQHDLARDEKLGLFLEICDIVAAAHRHGVIHRDLKPSNIRVDAGGRPHVLDFGLAQLDSHEKPGAEDLTLSTHFLGTIAYATPEQAAGGNTDTRTDVYALGVLIYEMLVGRRPYDTGGTFSEALRAIERSDPRAIRREVGADLEAIVLKALRKKPGDRYQSVDALADDLRRLRAGDSISVRPGSAGADLLRLMRRHRAVSSLIVMILALSVVVGVGSSIALAVIKQKNDGLASAKAEAEREAEKVAALAAFYEQMFESVRPDQAGTDVRVMELLDDASARLEADLETGPELRSFMHHRLGHTYVLLGSYDKAVEHLEKGAMHAEAIEDPDAAISVKIDLAQALSVRGDAERAETLMQETLIELLAIPEHSVILESQLVNALAAAAGARSDFAAAEPHYERSLELMLRGDPPRMELAAMYNNLGMTKEMLYKLDEAAELYAASLDLMDGDSPQDRYARASITHNLGNLARKSGDLDEAERRFRAALEASTGVFGADHPAVAETLETLASALTAKGELDEPDALLKRCLAIRQAALPPTHPKIASAIATHAELRFAQGRYAESVQMHTRARDLRAESLGEGHWLVGKSTISIARAHMLMDDPSLAWDLAVEGYRTIHASAGPETAENLGAVEFFCEIVEAWDAPPAACGAVLDELIAEFPDTPLADRLVEARKKVANP